MFPQLDTTLLHRRPTSTSHLFILVPYFVLEIDETNYGYGQVIIPVINSHARTRELLLSVQQLCGVANISNAELFLQKLYSQFHMCSNQYFSVMNASTNLGCRHVVTKCVDEETTKPKFAIKCLRNIQKNPGSSITGIRLH